MMKALAKKALARVGLDALAARAYWRAYGTLRFNSRIAKRVLADADEPKLQLGCGNHPLDGWLNTDASPRAADVMRLDAARRFPFPDDAFAYVYSEHMIEHVSFRSAERALAESFRVLAPGGKIRVSTPDLAFLIDLWRRDNAGGGDTFRAPKALSRLGKRRPAGRRRVLRDKPIRASVGASVHLRRADAAPRAGDRRIHGRDETRDERER